MQYSPSSENLKFCRNSKQSLRPAKSENPPPNGLSRKNSSNTAGSLCLRARQYAYAMVNWYRSVSNGGTRWSTGCSFPSRVAMIQFSVSGCCFCCCGTCSISVSRLCLSRQKSPVSHRMLTCDRVTLYTVTWFLLVYSLRPTTLMCSPICVCKLVWDVSTLWLCPKCQTKHSSFESALLWRNVALTEVCGHRGRVTVSCFLLCSIKWVTSFKKNKKHRPSET